MARALLLSGDFHASDAIFQALRGLEIECERHADHFSALEALTRHKFQLIATDLDFGSDAGFLLKTAGETLQKAPFRIAFAGRQDAHPQCNIFFPKPLKREEVTQALLQNDEFLKCLQVWSAEEDEKEDDADVTSRSHDFKQLSPAAVEFATGSKAGNPRRFLNLGWVGICALFACAAGLYHFRVAQRRADLVSAVTSPQAATMVIQQAADDTSIYPVDEPKPVLHMRAVNQPKPPEVKTLEEADAAEQPAEDQNDDQEISFNRADSPRALPASILAPMPSSPPPGKPSDEKIAVVQPTLRPVELAEGISETLLVRKVAATYPEVAQRNGIRGPVLFEALVGRDGTIRDLKMVEGPLLLGQAAYDAARQWRFLPYARDGEAVETITNITVEFSPTVLASVR